MSNKLLNYTIPAENNPVKTTTANQLLDVISLFIILITQLNPGRPEIGIKFCSKLKTYDKIKLWVFLSKVAAI